MGPATRDSWLSPPLHRVACARWAGHTCLPPEEREAEAGRGSGHRCLKPPGPELPSPVPSQPQALAASGPATPFSSAQAVPWFRVAQVARGVPRGQGTQRPSHPLGTRGFEGHLMDSGTAGVAWVSMPSWASSPRGPPAGLPCCAVPTPRQSPTLHHEPLPPGGWQGGAEVQLWGLPWR